MNSRNIFAVCLIGFVVSSHGSDPAGELRMAAKDFLSSLNAGQRAALTFELTDDVRATWSNLPIVMAPPAGVLLRNLDDVQRMGVHRMLRASLSSQGYSKSAAIMWLDDVLGEIETAALESNPRAQSNPLTVAMADDRNSGHYGIAIFGNPEQDNWGWKITGHHLAVNITVAGDRTGFMPVFLGSNPRVVGQGPYAGWMALPEEGQLGIELMRSLTAKQTAAATIAAEVPGDVFEGPGRRASLKKYEGLVASELKPRQLELLEDLVQEYVRNANGPSADAQFEAITLAGWSNVWFSWRGQVDENGKFYYRIHGPRILIEYNRQNENHDHAVVRDPSNDYGEDWLEHHYREFHPSMEKVMEDLQRKLRSD